MPDSTELDLLQDKLTWVDTAGMPDPKGPDTTFGLVQMGINIEDGKREPLYRTPLSDYPPTPIMHDGWQSATRIPVSTSTHGGKIR